MTLSAVLLAGGESRRMGKEKAAIIFRGKPLWQRQIELLRNLQPQKIFVSARKERSWRPADAELLLDEPPSRGPLSGLTIALQRTQTSHLVALAVDMPFMTADLLRFLCSLATPGCGVIPLIGDRAEPLAAIYPKEAESDFAGALASGYFSLQTLTRKLVDAGKLRVVHVAEEETNLYQSVNEPADLLLEDG